MLHRLVQWLGGTLSKKKALAQPRLEHFVTTSDDVSVRFTHARALVGAVREPACAQAWT